jgi:formylglycine-generating enzyme required for sulfatase activity
MPACVGGVFVAHHEPRRELVIRETLTHAELVFVAGGHLEAGEEFDAGLEKSVMLPAAEVSDYYLGRFEVSQAQWRVVMGGNPSRVIGERRPVEQVSWDDAVEFTKRLSVLSGRPFRLPSEAEWEWAFWRGRGQVKSSIERGARRRLLADYAGDSQRPIREVGARHPDALGLFDLDGNVSEWCADRYSPSPAEAGSRDEQDNGYRVLRGGAADAPYGEVEEAFRIAFDRSWVGRTVGFRLASPVKW